MESISHRRPALTVVITCVIEPMCYSGIVMEIFTIGHSNHTWEAFVALLKLHGIQVLVDIRTNPVSKYAAFANKKTLSALLAKDGVEYVYLGNSLGGMPADRSCYDAKGRPDYRAIRSMAFFQQGLDELLSLARDSRVAIMCAEEDPSQCHRRLLVGPALEQREATLLHIRADGSTQSSDTLAGRKAYQRQLQGTLPLEQSDG